MDGTTRRRMGPDDGVGAIDARWFDAKNEATPTNDCRSLRLARMV